MKDVMMVKVVLPNRTLHEQRRCFDSSFDVVSQKLNGRPDSSKRSLQQLDYDQVSADQELEQTNYRVVRQSHGRSCTTGHIIGLAE